MAITRKADAHWEGGIQSGNGKIHLSSGAFDGAYSYNTRFGDGTSGTNPEELLGAAHAACFTMALSGVLERAGHVASALDTTASVVVDREPAGFRITGITLKVVGKVPGITGDQFQEFATTAKTSCPLSKALAATEIHLEASLAE